MYMSHQMRPIFEGAKFAGFAVSVLLKQEEGHQGSAALSGMLAAIDEAPPDSVYMMVVDNGADIAGMGSLMGTAMAVRDFAGAVPVDLGQSLSICRLEHPCSLRRVFAGACLRRPDNSRRTNLLKIKIPTCDELVTKVGRTR
jgi:hypothetical protein